MKTKLTVLALAAFAATTTQATVRQVDNNANNPGVYTTIQAAHNAASAGDTLYIHSSPTQYATANIEKQVTIIGEGSLPDKISRFRTVLAGLNFGFNVSNSVSSSGSKVYGCYVSSVNIGMNGLGTIAVNNITLQRNYIGAINFSGISSNLASANSGILISNNVIGTIANGAIYNCIIRNNIIHSTVCCMGSELVGTWTLSNNVFYGAGISSLRSAVISNNIFYASGNAVGNSQTSCTFLNNCLFVPNSSYVYTAADVNYGTTTGSNNLFNLDPLFIDPVGTLQDYSYTIPAAGSPTANFNLQNGSPCIAAGSDGLDLGIYGGLAPYFEGIPADSRYRYYPMPNIPAVLDMNILNTTVLPNGTLDVNFISRKQN